MNLSQALSYVSVLSDFPSSAFYISMSEDFKQGTEIPEKVENTTSKGAEKKEKGEAWTGKTHGILIGEGRVSISETAADIVDGKLWINGTCKGEADAVHISSEGARVVTIEEALEIRVYIQNEDAYLANHPDSEALQGRYEDTRTGAEYVLHQIDEFKRSRGVEAINIPAIKEKPFDTEAREHITEAVRIQLERYFLNKETGSYNQKKYESVLEETKRYLDLIEIAQKEGDIPVDISAETVLKMVEENMAALAFQDRVAIENMLGDHGVRHLVDHNITVGEEIFDQLTENGQEVKAIDRLMLHQIMIDHDLGYAMDPVREGINDGKFGVDKGHNVLAAKFIRERGSLQGDTMRALFSQEQIASIHQGILNHDSSEIKFSLDNSQESRTKNIESAVHLADNTHAFESKLPELLYGFPDSIETMRLLKVAGEIGSIDMVVQLKERLAQQIQTSTELSDDDKEALIRAAQSLQPSSYKFSVPRICGNNPEFKILQDGKVEISTQESSIHREAVGLFGQEALTQLKKFIKDLGGPKVVDLDADTIETNDINFRIGKAEQGVSDYQEKIQELISNEEFRHFSIEDDRLSSQMKAIEGVLNADSETQEKGASQFRMEGDERPAQQVLEEREDHIKSLRLQLLTEYTESNPT